MSSASLPVRRIIKFHRGIGLWTFMLSKEAPIEEGPYAMYQYGSGRHPYWQLNWWRR